MKKEGFFMNEHTTHLLQECNSGAKMAINSTEQILKYVKSDRLKKHIEESKEAHQKLLAETQKLLAESGEDGKEPGMIASAFSWATTELKLAFENEDKKVAEIMMDGCNMGVQSLSKYMNEYTEASKESVDLCRRLIKEEEHFAKVLKEFL